MLTDRDVIKRLQSAVQAAGSQRAFAAAHGVSEQYLSDVLRGRREIGQKILDTLGLERVVSYREADRLKKDQ
jgi:DNA-binding transcriptional regulator YdaS (Cro superfamily)